MSIFNSFSVGFSSLCHSVVFVLCIFSFLKTESFYVSVTELSDKEKINESKSKSDVNKHMKTIYYA